MKAYRAATHKVPIRTLLKLNAHEDVGGPAVDMSNNINKGDLEWSPLLVLMY